MLHLTGTPAVSLHDRGSSYGCYVGEQALQSSAQSSQVDRIPKGETITLAKNVRVRFGLHSTIFKLIWQDPFTACTSTLSVGDKKKVVCTLNDLVKGSKVVADWSDTIDFLVMGEVILTIKVANALAKGVPIVTPSFFEDFIQSVKTKQVLPNPKNYIPKLKENALNSNEVSLAVNTKRSTLFKGKLLAFSTQQQMVKFNTAIEYSGGKAVVLDLEKPNPEIFKNPVNMLVQTESDEVSSLWMQCIKQAEIKGLRPIPEIQIGLAIITINTTIYCNPAANRQVIANGKKDRTLVDSNTHSVLVNETQFGKTQKGITQVPSDQTCISSTSNNTRGNVDETFITPTPGPSKSQASALGTNNSSYVEPTDSQIEEDSVYHRPTEGKMNEEMMVSNYRENKSIQNHNIGLSQFADSKASEKSICNDKLEEYSTLPQKSDAGTPKSQDLYLRGGNTMKGVENPSIPHSIIGTAKENSQTKSKGKFTTLGNDYEDDINLFNFNLDEPNSFDSKRENKKRKQLSPPRKQSTQKRHCSRDSRSDDIENESDTFDFELSPIKRKHNEKPLDNKENPGNEVIKNARKRNAIDDGVETDAPSKLPRQMKPSEDEEKVNANSSTAQSTQRSTASSFISTSYGFIGKRNHNTSKNNHIRSSAGKPHNEGDFKLESIEDNKSEVLQEVSRSFVNMEIVSLVVKCTTDKRTSEVRTNVGTNVKQFKKQAYVQTVNHIKTKPIAASLTMQDNEAALPFNIGNSADLGNALWSEDKESQKEYEENNTRNEVEEKEADAFWNFQSSQDPSQSSSRNLPRSRVR